MGFMQGINRPLKNYRYCRCGGRNKPEEHSESGGLGRGHQSILSEDKRLIAACFFGIEFT